MRMEVQERLTTGLKCYYALLNTFKNRKVLRKVKLIFITFLLGEIFLWGFTKREDSQNFGLKRKVLRTDMTRLRIVAFKEREQIKSQLIYIWDTDLLK